MKLTALLLFFSLFGGEPKQYPLRLRIIHVDEDHNLRWGWWSGHGIANVREEDGTLHGIDFEFDHCDNGFKGAVGDLWYEARLKKPLHLGVAAKQLGSEKTNECEFRIENQTFRYVIKNGQRSTAPAIVIPLKGSTE